MGRYRLGDYKHDKKVSVHNPGSVCEDICSVETLSG